MNLQQPAYLRFSRVCGTHRCVTNTQIDNTILSCSNRPHVRYACDAAQKIPEDSWVCVRNVHVFVSHILQRSVGFGGLISRSPCGHEPTAWLNLRPAQKAEQWRLARRTGRHQHRHLVLVWNRYLQQQANRRHQTPQCHIRAAPCWVNLSISLFVSGL